jgi:hypothetical protein
MSQRSRARLLREQHLASRLMNKLPDASNVPAPSEQRRRPSVDDPERAEIELVVRAAAVASLTEFEFVERIRSHGIVIRACTGANQITGYTLQYDGGHSYRETELGADLVLPVLRENWDSGYQARIQAADAWLARRIATPFDRNQVRLTHPVIWTRMIGDARQFATSLRSVHPAQTPTWAHAAARTAGALAAWSLRPACLWREQFAMAALELARSAQDSAPAPIRPRIRAELNQVGFGLASLDPEVVDLPRQQLLLLVQLVDVLLLVTKTHMTRRELSRWQALDDIGSMLGDVCLDLHARAQRGRRQR